VNNSCCTADPTGPGEAIGKCVSQGIYSDNKKYLCDPPGWNFDEVKPEAKVQNILELIIFAFSHFFFQR
jgi:hypothetical protein